ncbi:hypothetical protein LguiB_021478 [Lonicera macranthoides]
MPVKKAVSWNAMLSGYAQNWFAEEAVELFTEMMNASVQPDKTLFVAVISSCPSHADDLESVTGYALDLRIFLKHLVAEECSSDQPKCLKMMFDSSMVEIEYYTNTDDNGSNNNNNNIYNKLAGIPCKEAGESINRISLNCKFASLIWHWIFSLFGFSGRLPASYSDFRLTIWSDIRVRRRSKIFWRCDSKLQSG